MINHAGSNNPNWRGGKHITTDGYVKVYRPSHKNATKAGYILEHRLVMSEKIMRPLLKNEVVHHRNTDRTDNHRRNLKLYIKKTHDYYEATIRSRDVCGRFRQERI